jgi:hypothetical protein
MCSTPQKQPAATVARWAPSGSAAEPSGPKRIVLLVNGRVRREKRDVMLKAMEVMSTRKEKKTTNVLAMFVMDKISCRWTDLFSMNRVT